MKAICFSNFCGCQTSSLSINAIYSPFAAATPVFLASIEENNYEFSQIEIENLQVTAELIEWEEAGFHSTTVCFTKDSIVYYYLFSCKGKLDMAAVTAVLETLE